MDYQFTFDWSVLGVIVAPDIEGSAEILATHDDWHVVAIELESYDGKASVILPIDHPLFRDIKAWLYRERRAEIEDALGFGPFACEHRLTKRELV